MSPVLSLGHIPHWVEISRCFLSAQNLETVLPAECSEPNNDSLTLLKSLHWFYGFSPRLCGTSKKAKWHAETNNSSKLKPPMAERGFSMTHPQEVMYDQFWHFVRVEVGNHHKLHLNLSLITLAMYTPFSTSRFMSFSLHLFSKAHPVECEI